MTGKGTGPAVLIYRVPAMSRPGAALRRYLRQEGIRAVEVSSGDGGRSVGALLGLRKDAAAGTADLPDHPVLVLSGLGERSLDRLLDFLRRECPVELKAVATPTNLSWSFARLAGELAREHTQLHSK